tara:strand:- start:29 stop:535 length:507 start_codon:yes stop_codon:yes gene_type:complete
MVDTSIKNINLNTKDIKRQKNIISKLNLKKLPFNISLDKICDLNLEMVRHSRSVLKYQEDKPGIKWCFSSIKKLKVFLIIFESNELGEEIYKEKISSKLPEYSYKTVAQVVDDGIKKNFFIKLEARRKKNKDLKIRNIRPSEEVIIEFINWKIDLLSSLMKFRKDLIN